jgi:SNF2 family DNA or RNA helicase
MEVIENAVIKCKVPKSAADRIKQLVDKSEIIKTSGSEAEILINWDYTDIARSTYLLDMYAPRPDIPNLPSPIIRDYKWPGLYKPFQHQIETASFLSIRDRAFCFNEAGTGKTSAAVWAADYLMIRKTIRRVLVICPLSIMYSAWQADIFNTAMHRTCGIAHGSSDKRKKVIAGDYNFVIINFDGVSTVFNELKAANFDLIIVDEANAYKTASTKRWKTLSRLLLPSTKLWMMTGTPASQSPLDAYGLAKMVSPSRVPSYVTQWRDRVMFPTSRFKWEPKQVSKELVFRALQPAIRFTKRECLDLPEVTYQMRDVPVTPQVAKYYRTIKTQLMIEAAGQQVSAVNAAAAMSKLLQISGGAVYTDKRDIIEFDVSPRLEELKNVIDETSNKVIVFVPFIHTIDIVLKFLRSEGHTCEVIKGDVNARERASIINRFQTQSDPRILVIQPQSASHGVTLTAADTLVFWSPVMSVETYLQCIGRIDRVGQKNKCTVVHLQGSDAERRVYKMLQGKVDHHFQLVDLYKQELEEV